MQQQNIRFHQLIPFIRTFAFYSCAPKSKNEHCFILLFVYNNVYFNKCIYYVTDPSGQV